ncbi:hypothetical protein [Halomonas binhaiensis]|uniref:Uncharacterized protein n=1 Tax=Halomonas binhaiensis TaxID=2562282 RepID=A0A5C1NKU8_9GAMM|nr:hypothetical protein [Halomonas binhaiensis]QEM82988.1 hypothetical protein E4T21_16615 [Halomonas binhaiensis]
MKVYKAEWQCTLNVTEGVDASAGWRYRLAWYLRNIAERIDGAQRTLTLDLNVCPEIESGEVDTCLGKGFAVSQQLLMELAQHAACESAMRDTKAELFDGDE